MPMDVRQRLTAVRVLALEVYEDCELLDAEYQQCGDASKLADGLNSLRRKCSSALSLVKEVRGHVVSL